MRSPIPAAAIVFTGLLAAGATAADPIKLSDVIEAVRKNEKLYRDMDVVVRTEYDIGDRKPVGKDEVFRMEHRTRFVSQGDWFRLEREGTSRTGEGTFSMDRVRAFDGDTTRLLEKKAVGNISTGRVEDGSFVRPHLTGYWAARVVVPLSTYLSGTETVRADPDNRLTEGINLDVSYHGVESVSGLWCHKVVVNKILGTGTVHDREEVWLAEDRNYLPVRILAYTHRFSKDRPVGEGGTDKFKEVRPGVWFPAEATFTAFNKRAIQEDGSRVLQWRERHAVDEVRLDPKHPREFFAKVDFPAGTAMYEVEKGKIVKSWRQGDDREPGREKP